MTVGIHPVPSKPQDTCNLLLHVQSYPRQSHISLIRFSEEPPNDSGFCERPLKPSDSSGSGF